MREEYELICTSYYNRIYLFLYKLCGNKELTEDLTQETFYQALLSLHRFKGSSDMFTFIAAIAKHTYFKHLKKANHFNGTVNIADIAELLSDDSTFNPERIYEQYDDSIGLRSVIDSLPEKYKDVILYRIYAEMTYEQIADTMKITQNSAKVLFFRAKKKLQEELKNGNYL